MLVNTQGRTILGMFLSAPAEIVVREAVPRPVFSLLNNKKRRYSYRLLAVPTTQLTRDILPVTLSE